MSDPHTAEIQRRLDQLESTHRHWVSISCDRCHVALTISCSVQADLDAHLHATAVALGWIVGHASMVGMGQQPTPSTFVRDFCPACAPLLAPGRH